MADEEKKDEVVEEEVTTEEEATEENSAEDENLEAMKEFDDKIDSDDDDSADDDEVDDGEETDDSAEEEVEEEKETESVDSMDAAVDALEKEIEAEAAKSDEQKATEAAEAKAKAAEEAEAAKADEEKPFDCGLNTDPDAEGEVYDTAMVEAMNKQGQAMQDRAKKAEAETERVLSIVDRQAAQRTADWLDTKFNGLGENFDEALGKGEFEDLEPGSDQQKNRMAVSSRMGVIVQAYEKQGKQVPSRNQLFTKAVNKLFSKESKQPETEKKTIKKAKKRAGQTLGGGSKKSSVVSASKSMDKAMKDFDAKLDD